jgi:DNA-binding transcriptional LysR family regulator
MDWNNLRAFLAVARTGRVSVAARQLGVRHTTVSRQLAALEDELAAPLFNRTAGGYLLTAVGQEILGTVENMQHAADGIGATVTEKRGILEGRVRLAMPPEFATHWVVPRLGVFGSQWPNLELQILVGSRQRDLSRGEAELAVQAPRPRQVGLVAARIGRSAAALYVSRALAGAKRMRVQSVEDLRGLPLLAYVQQLSMLQRAPWFQKILESGRVLIETNSTHTLLAAAHASAGIAVLPRFVAIREEGLVAVSEPVAEHDVWLVTHPEFRRDPKVRAAADFLKQIASGTNGLS